MYPRLKGVKKAHLVPIRGFSPHRSLSTSFRCTFWVIEKRNQWIHKKTISVNVSFYNWYLLGVKIKKIKPRPNNEVLIRLRDSLQNFDDTDPLLLIWGSFYGFANDPGLPNDPNLVPRFVTLDWNDPEPVNDPQPSTANDPGSQKINIEWHGWWNDEDRELTWIAICILTPF